MNYTKIFHFLIIRQSLQVFDKYLTNGNIIIQLKKFVLIHAHVAPSFFHAMVIKLIYPHIRKKKTIQSNGFKLFLQKCFLLQHRLAFLANILNKLLKMGLKNENFPIKSFKTEQLSNQTSQDE